MKIFLPVAIEKQPIDTENLPQMVIGSSSIKSVTVERLQNSIGIVTAVLLKSCVTVVGDTAVTGPGCGSGEAVSLNGSFLG